MPLAQHPSPCLPQTSWISSWGEPLDMMPGSGPILKVEKTFLPDPHAPVFLDSEASSMGLDGTDMAGAQASPLP